MTNEEMRKSICGQLKLVDRTTLKMIHAMLQEYNAPGSAEDEAELLRELSKISKAQRSGDTASYAAEPAIEYVRANRKKSRK